METETRQTGVPAQKIQLPEHSLRVPAFDLIIFKLQNKLY
jgi:hypothetical protein